MLAVPLFPSCIGRSDIWHLSVWGLGVVEQERENCCWQIELCVREKKVSQVAQRERGEKGSRNTHRMRKGERRNLVKDRKLLCFSFYFLSWYPTEGKEEGEERIKKTCVSTPMGL